MILIDVIRKKVKKIHIEVVAVEGDAERQIVGMNSSLQNNSPKAKASVLDQRACVEKCNNLHLNARSAWMELHLIKAVGALSTTISN